MFDATFIVYKKSIKFIFCILKKVQQRGTTKLIAYLYCSNYLFYFCITLKKPQEFN